MSFLTPRIWKFGNFGFNPIRTAERSLIVDCVTLSGHCFDLTAASVANYVSVNPQRPRKFRISTALYTMDRAKNGYLTILRLSYLVLAKLLLLSDFWRIRNRNVLQISENLAKNIQKMPIQKFLSWLIFFHSNQVKNLMSHIGLQK